MSRPLHNGTIGGTAAAHLYDILGLDRGSGTFVETRICEDKYTVTVHGRGRRVGITQYVDGNVEYLEINTAKQTTTRIKALASGTCLRTEYDHKDGPLGPERDNPLPPTRSRQVARHLYSLTHRVMALAAPTFRKHDVIPWGNHERG